jgi:valyl-tRNA synthetase
VPKTLLWKAKSFGLTDARIAGLLNCPEKDLAAARKELTQTEAKLGNEAFIAKAPEQVVAKIKARKETAAADIDRITARLAALPAS